MGVSPTSQARMVRPVLSLLLLSLIAASLAESEEQHLVRRYRREVDCQSQVCKDCRTECSNCDNCSLCSLIKISCDKGGSSSHLDPTSVRGAPSAAVRDPRSASRTATKARTLRPARLVTRFVKSSNM